MSNVTNCKLDLTKVSKEDKEHIGRGFLACIEDYFKKPGVEEDFRLWQEQRYKMSV